MRLHSHPIPHHHQHSWLDRALQVLSLALIASCSLLLVAAFLRSIYLTLPKAPPPAQSSPSAPSLLSAPIVGGLSHDWLTSLALGIAVTLIISLLATALGWMTAWHLITKSARLQRLTLALAFIPMVMPAAISYAGWWLLRQPTWPLGDYLALHASGNFLTTLGQLTAIITMSLWLWPITSIILVHHLRALPIDALCARLQLSHRASAQALALRLMQGPIIITCLLAMQLAMGSAVSLHLTQLPVPGVDVWARLALDPTLQNGWPGGAWWLAWCGFIAAIVCCIFARKVLSPPPPRDQFISASFTPSLRRCAPPLTFLITSLTLIAVVIIPLITAALTLRRFEYLPAFWREHGSAVRQSLEQGLIVALLAIIMTLAWSHLFILMQRIAHRTQFRPLLITLTAILFTLAMTIAIAPGVLIGQSLAWLFNRLTPTITTSDFVDLLTVPLAHTLRFAIVPIFIAALITLPTSRDRDDLHRSLPLNLRALWNLTWKPSLWLIILAAASGMLLSMQEIEVALQITPPGRRSLAIVLLDMLHMNSVQELASVIVQVLLIAALIALLAWSIATNLLRRAA